MLGDEAVFLFFRQDKLVGIVCANLKCAELIMSFVRDSCLSNKTGYLTSQTKCSSYF